MKKVYEYWRGPRYVAVYRITSPSGEALVGVVRLPRPGRAHPVDVVIPHAELLTLLKGGEPSVGLPKWARERLMTGLRLAMRAR